MPECENPLWPCAMTGAAACLAGFEGIAKNAKNKLAAETGRISKSSTERQPPASEIIQISGAVITKAELPAAIISPIGLLLFSGG